MDGHDWFLLAGPELDQEELREAWRELQPELLVEHARNQGLFSRPWGWWAFDAPEPRRWAAEWPMGVIDESVQPWFGCPCTFSDGARGILGGCDREWFETEQDYLLRHPKLMTDAEKDVLAAETVTQTTEV